MTVDELASLIAGFSDGNSSMAEFVGSVVGRIPAAIAYRASWVLPITGPPLPDAWVTIDRGRIASVGASHSDTSGKCVDLGRVAILPGLVNAHTHLELSYLRGIIPRASRFTQWIREVMQRRREHSDPTDAVIVEAARRAIEELRSCGTAVVGDVSNTLVTLPLMQEAAVPGVVFYELLGFTAADPKAMVRAARDRLDAQQAHADIRTALAAHAPYSVSPSLFDAIKADLDQHPDAPTSVHLGESGEEVEFIAEGTGSWRALLAELGVWNEAWRPVGRSPVEYLAARRFLDRQVLAVHGVQCTEEDLHCLAKLEVRVVSCPRSNRHVGVGSPRLQAFFDAGLEVAFGTDSLASVDDLNLFAELAEARRIAPRIHPRRLLESATLTGARALGFDGQFGSIEPGKRAALVAVALPEHVGDVEEYLVSGIGPEMIKWLET